MLKAYFVSAAWRDGDKTYQKSGRVASSDGPLGAAKKLVRNTISYALGEALTPDFSAYGSDYFQGRVDDTFIDVEVTEMAKEAFG